jgi:hypothetical protein
LRDLEARAALACALTLALACSSSSGGTGHSTGGSDGGGDAVDAPAEAARDVAVKDTGARDTGSADTRAADTASPDAAAADAGSCGTTCSNTKRAEAICVLSVDAQLVDTTGAPAAGHMLFVCGTDTCSTPIKTDAQGKAHFDLCLNMVEPALKYLGDDAAFVGFASALSGATETFPAATLTALPLEGQAFPASDSGSVSSGGVTLAVSAAPTFDPTMPSDSSSEEFRAASVALADAPPGLEASLGVKALWGLWPLNAKLSPAGALTVPNPDPTGWPAGTQVDFVMNGMDEGLKPAVPYGGWGTIGTGTVSQDGTNITTDTGTGDGLPILGPIVGVAPHI